MAGVGKRFTKDDPRANRKGRKPGAKNRWRKAELEKMREHLQRVLDANPGGLEEFLSKLLRTKRNWGLFVSLLRDQSPKPPAAVEMDATVTVRWQDEAPAEEKPK